MSVTIIKHGLLDTIQDEGRFGFQHLGINAGGSMDVVAANIANILVGNEKTEPVIELHFPAASFSFREDCLVALTGADFHPVIDDKAISMNTAIIVATKSVLKFNHLVTGCRCYLAVHGGWNAESWLNSYSTNTKISAGGYKGRVLRKDDIIEIKNAKFIPRKAAQNSIVPEVKADTSIFYATKKIRCVAGAEYDWLDKDAKTRFQSSSFTVTPQSDRMGYRLQGEELKLPENFQLLSSAVTTGTIQLLPSGQVIILMADHQTTGGYPKIAHVISADIPKLAQMHANERLEFELIAHAEAEEEFMQQQRCLQQLEQSIKLQLQQILR